MSEIFRVILLFESIYLIVGGIRICVTFIIVILQSSYFPADFGTIKA